MSEKSGFLDVYVARLPISGVDVERIEHSERRAEIEKIKNRNVAREKYYAWLLLERALSLRFGRSAEELGVHRSALGAWESPFCKISLSHTAGAVAVAVSSDGVGVDIECDVPPRAENFAQRALAPRELAELLRLPENERGRKLLRLWTAKEAIFKSRGEGSFVPRNIDTATGVVSTEIVLGGDSFVLSVASALELAHKCVMVDLCDE